MRTHRTFLYYPPLFPPSLLLYHSPIINCPMHSVESWHSLLHCKARKSLLNFAAKICRKSKSQRCTSFEQGSLLNWRILLYQTEKTHPGKFWWLEGPMVVFFSFFLYFFLSQISSFLFFFFIFAETKAQIPFTLQSNGVSREMNNFWENYYL